MQLAAELPLQRPSAAPFKTLAVLAGLVGLAHLLILEGSSQAVRFGQAPVTRPFTTRTIQLNPARSAAPPDVPGPIAALPASLPAVRPIARQKAPRPSSGETGPIVALTPVFESNQPTVPVTYGQYATNTVAIEAPTVDATAAPAMPVASAPPAAAAPAAAITVPYQFAGSTRLQYNVIGTKGNLTYQARAELLWLQDGASYESRLEVSAFLIGSRVRTSTGKITAAGLAPVRFADKFRSEVAAHFDRDKQRVTFSANTPEAPLLPGAQDQLSVLIQLGALLGGAPERYPSGSEFSFETIGPRSAENWVLRVDELEQLDLPGGQMSALKLTRHPAGDYDGKAELWLAPSMGYLPVRVKLYERSGDYVDQVWRATEKP